MNNDTGNPMYSNKTLSHRNSGHYEFLMSELGLKRTSAVRGLPWHLTVPPLVFWYLSLESDIQRIMHRDIFL